jgi:phosphatidylglycerophosphatase A
MVEKWPGGVGVMADDVIAGVFAALCLWLAQWFLLAG